MRVDYVVSRCRGEQLSHRQVDTGFVPTVNLLFTRAKVRMCISLAFEAWLASLWMVYKYCS